MRSRSFRARAVTLASAATVALSAAGADPTPGRPPPEGAAPTAAKPVAPEAGGRIDINRASRAELKKLPGIGDAEARRIVAGRPWLTKIDLVTKGVIPEGIYVAIKGRIYASQPKASASKK